MMIEKARYTHDGYPANLAAAAYDAAEWLEALNAMSGLFEAEDHASLARCLTALRRELRPCLPSEHEPKPMRFPGVVAEIIQK